MHTLEHLLNLCFALKKYPQYPDSNSINKKIYDSLKPKGLIKIKNLKISLTNHGLELAKQYFHASSGQNQKVDSNTELTKAEIIDLKRLFKHKGFQLYLENNKVEVLDIDIYDFFEVTVRTTPSDNKNRFSIINALISKALKTNNPEIEKLSEYKNILVKKYEEIKNGNSSWTSNH